eukprot:NODE_8510_length_406_cov_60.557423_g7634_i0.p5 GENE.NODE_8510_length_406_cov_60.557423_g7634_i0~~NODE_8510_length_406_cov_60.557423_g7634_i0.p5  ORF type:complete len:50 (-),score=4.26 NODE_8510_length_406_cov_60.557423_g7634_i0:96-245(-)
MHDDPRTCRMTWWQVGVVFASFLMIVVVCLLVRKFAPALPHHRSHAINT